MRILLAREAGWQDITDTRSQLLLGLVFTPASPAIHAFYEPSKNGLDQPGYEHCGDPTGHEYKNIHHEASPNKVCRSHIKQHVVWPKLRGGPATIAHVRMLAFQCRTPFVSTGFSCSSAALIARA